MTMITPSYLGETIEYSSLHACRSTLEDPTVRAHCGRKASGCGFDRRGHGAQLCREIEREGFQLSEPRAQTLR